MPDKVMVYAMTAAFGYGDGHVRIVVPDYRLKRGGETDDQFITRVATEAEQHDPSLTTATAKQIIDKSVIDALPKISGVVGSRKQARQAWRFNAGRTAVVVDAAALALLPVVPRL